MRFLILAEVFLALASDDQPPAAWIDEPPVAWIAPAPAPRPVLPTDPSQPAPSGWEWKRYQGQPWQLYRVEVSHPATPFAVSGSTRLIPASSAVGVSTSSSGMFPVVTFTAVPRAATSGGTNCSPSG